MKVPEMRPYSSGAGRVYQPLKRFMEKSANSTRVKAPKSVEEERHRYDSTGLKPSRRPADDGRINSETTNNKRNTGIMKKSVLFRKCITKIGTLNVRAIRAVEKREELGHLFEESGMQILAIQEHRILHGEPIMRTRIGIKSYLITTSAVKNSAQAAVGGVGFVISAEAYKLVREITPETPYYSKTSITRTAGE